jgi:hypothetical protein
VAEVYLETGLISDRGLGSLWNTSRTAAVTYLFVHFRVFVLLVCVCVRACANVCACVECCALMRLSL